MNGKQLLKYKIGFLVIGLFTVALLVVVLIQAGGTRQDTQTDKLANSMADKLNGYTDSNFSTPATLRKAGITKTSPYISYARQSDSTYKFCVTYKATSSDFDPSTAVDNVLAGGMSSWDTSADSGDASDLYIPTSHHKGANCQTIDVGLDDGSGGLGCGGPIIAPQEDTSTTDSNFACPLQSGDAAGGAGATGPGDTASGSTPVACGQDYDASTEESIVMSITAKNIQVASPGVDPTDYTIAPTAKFFDQTCQPISWSDIHVGETVSVFSSMSANAATTIQKVAGA